MRSVRQYMLAAAAAATASAHTSNNFLITESLTLLTGESKTAYCADYANTGNYFLTSLAALGWFLCLFWLFIGLALVCDDYLAPALEVCSTRLKIPIDVACATFLALGSSAPEIVISCVGTFTGKVDTSVGAVLGSAIIAYAAIPAACIFAIQDGEGFARFLPGNAESKELVLETAPLVRDNIFFLVSLGLFVVFGLDSKMTVAESGILFSIMIIYLLVLFFMPTSIEAVEEEQPLLEEVKKLGSPSSVITSHKRRQSVDETASPSSLPNSPPENKARKRFRAAGNKVMAAARMRMSAQTLPGMETSPELSSKQDDTAQDDTAQDDTAPSLSEEGSGSGAGSGSEPIEQAAPAPEEAAEASSPAAEESVVDIEKNEAEDEKKDQPTQEEEEEEGEEEDPGCVGTVMGVLSKPWEVLYRVCIPEVDEEEENDGTTWYFLATVFVALVLVSCISEGVLEFTEELACTAGISKTLSGVTIVALGAQIPDTFGSMAVAKLEGGGAGAIANSLGSQIINIVVGVAVPFLLFSLIKGEPVVVHQGHIKVAGMCLMATVLVLVALCFSRCARAADGKPGLNLSSAWILMATYVISVTVIVMHTLHVF